MIPYIEQPSVHIGPLMIYAFGAIVACSLIVGDFLFMRRVAHLRLDARTASRLEWYALVGGFVLAHVFSVVLYFPQRIASDPLLLVRVWEDVSSFGGMIGGVVGVAVFFRWRAKPLDRDTRWAYLDAAAFILPFAWAVGRVACSLAHDHPGTLTHFPLSISLSSFRAQTYIAGVYRDAGRLAELPSPAALGSYGFHDLGWYELVYLVLVMWPVFLWLNRRRQRRGTFIIAFAALYAPMRLAFDSLRVVDARYAGLTPGQYASGLMLLMAWWVWRHTRLDTRTLARHLAPPNHHQPP